MWDPSFHGICEHIIASTDAQAPSPGFIPPSLLQCLPLQLTINVAKNTKRRGNYSNSSTEIIGVDTCQQWEHFLSKLKYLEIFLKFQIMQIPFPEPLQDYPEAPHVPS